LASRHFWCFGVPEGFEVLVELGGDTAAQLIYLNSCQSRRHIIGPDMHPIWVSNVRKLSILAVITALSIFTVVSAGLAQRRAGGWHRGGFHSRSFHGGIYFGTGPWWSPWWSYPYAYPYPYQGYYSYPLLYPNPYTYGNFYAPPPVYIEKEQSNQYWYYCADARKYYPYVKSCPSGWMKVVPQTSGPSHTPAQ
jgi:hypothetical protein